MNNDTIVAISTSIGTGPIGIVRLSGEDSLAIADKMFFSLKGDKPSSYASGTVHYGHIKTPGHEVVIDEVLLTVMNGPKTYTTEDVVEINCHGGIVSLKKVLELCLTEGARLAEPGEFTRRAFLNGRIDLAQAEAVLDIIKSETDISQKASIEQLRGTFSEAVHTLRNSIIDILSFIEVAIDFSDEDVEFLKAGDIAQRMNDIYLAARKMIETSTEGMILRVGVSVAICGKPNVGKSSLMNALLRQDRVIVAAQAGTTRDVIEESIDIAGVKVRLSDTAGIIKTRERIEAESVKRSRERIETSDIIIFMLDNSCPLSAKDEEIYRIVKDKKTITVVNKVDLAQKIDIGKMRKKFGEPEILEISVLKKRGLGKIEDAIIKLLFNGTGRIQEGPIVTNIRHKEALVKAAEAVKRAVHLAGKTYNGELIASDLNEAVYWLGLIIGESVSDEVLDRIFSQFCIGK